MVAKRASDSGKYGESIHKLLQICDMVLNEINSLYISNTVVILTQNDLNKQVTQCLEIVHGLLF